MVNMVVFNASSFCILVYYLPSSFVVCQQPLKLVLLVTVISSSIPMEVMTKQLGRKERGSLTPLWSCRECHSVGFCVGVLLLNVFSVLLYGVSSSSYWEQGYDT